MNHGEYVRKNIEFIEEVQVDGITVGRFIPFPGSDMGDNLAKHNILSIKEKTCMNIGKHLDRKPNILRTDMSEENHTEIMEFFFSYYLIILVSLTGEHNDVAGLSVVDRIGNGFFGPGILIRKKGRGGSDMGIQGGGMPG